MGVTSDYVEQFLAARERHRQVPPPSETRALSSSEAYEIQDRVRGALLGRGEQLIGWKVAYTTRAFQMTYQVQEPASAFLLASGVYASGAEVPVARFASSGVEAELAFVMREDLSGPGVTPARALRAIDGVLPALELVDIRLSGKPTGLDFIADGIGASAIVLGAPLTPVAHLDLALEGLVYEHNGAIAGTAAAAAVLGSPLNSLTWVANHLGARGLGLKAGDLVMSGSISTMLHPKAGDTVRATFTRLGSVAVRFV